MLTISVDAIIRMTATLHMDCADLLTDNY